MRSRQPWGIAVRVARAGNPLGPRRCLEVVSDRWQFRAFEPRDEAAILASFERVFAHVDPAHRRRDEAHWRWLFRSSPAGARAVLAVGSNGEVRAQYATLRQRMDGDAAKFAFAQAVDSFDLRRTTPALARQSAFVQAGERYAALYGDSAAAGAGKPWSEQPDNLVYGLAISAAFRVGARRLGYDHLRTIRSLVARAEDLPATRSAELVDARATPLEIDALCRVSARGRGMLAWRDSAGLDWRFRDHPRWRYRFTSLADAAGLRAQAVWRAGEFGGLRAVWLCDFQIAVDDDAALEGLLHAGRELSRELGESDVGVLVSDAAVEWLSLQRRGFSVRATPYVLAMRSFEPALERDTLFWRWHYTLADTDLV